MTWWVHARRVGLLGDGLGGARFGGWMGRAGVGAAALGLRAPHRPPWGLGEKARAEDFPTAVGVGAPDGMGALGSARAQAQVDAGALATNEHGPVV